LHHTTTARRSQGLARKHVSKVAIRNTRTVDIAIPNIIAAGTATLTLVLKTAPAPNKTVMATVNIPKPA